MKAPWILTAMAAAGHLAAGSGLATPLAPTLHRPSPDLVLVQNSDRVARLWQNRSIIENALQPPGRVIPAVPIEPQSRALQAPEPLPPEPLPPAALPQQPALPPEADTEFAQAQVSCEEAAAIVSDYGFSDVRESSCSGEIYRFSAMRDGTAYSIGVTAAAGEIAEVSRE